MRIGWVVSSVLVCALALATPVVAQEQGEEPFAETLNLFFDCQGSGCFDLDFFRREIPYVNWVRDREDADLHVLVTSRTTGGGGREYQLSFIGRRDWAGQDQMLLVSTSGDATTDETRTSIARRLAVGLVQYLADTPVADRLRISAATPEGMNEAPASAQDDPWNFWVFRVGLNGFLNGESSQGFSNLNGSANANRTTEDWKFDLGGRYSRNTNRFELSDGSTVRTVREDWSSNLLLVKSLTEHWSLGARGETGKSTFTNEDFRISFAPGLEYNVFPYDESSRRSLTVQGVLEGRYWDYDEITIYGQTEEFRVAGSLAASLDFVQPWGRANISLVDSHYLHDTRKYRLSLFGSTQVRLFRGFSVNLSGSWSRIRDQLHISAAGVSNEDILLRQRQLATNYSYFVSFGVSYRFGSIFNNVVNPRFGSGGGGGVIFMF